MMYEFQNGLLGRDLAALRTCPKADLHSHGLLGGDCNYLSLRTGMSITPLRSTLSSMRDMHDWTARNLGPLFSSREGRWALFEACFVRAQRDGVTRIVVGDDALAARLYRGSAEEVTNDLRALHRIIAPNIEWIPQLTLSRNRSVESLQRWLQPFLSLKVYRAVDLAGDELSQPVERFKPLYRLCKAEGVRLAAHIGEWGTADDVWRAVEELELDEVQHGIAAADSPTVMRFLADNGIRLNVCPTSNVVLGRARDLRSHPIRKLYDAGVRVTINTDDVLVFGP
jgi:adenosine deaminase